MGVWPDQSEELYFANGRGKLSVAHLELEEEEKNQLKFL